MSYAPLKYLHITCAATSYALFLLRGIWMLRGSALMRQRWVKITGMASVRPLMMKLAMPVSLTSILSRKRARKQTSRYASFALAPHMVDTVLLGSAVALAWSIGQYPFIDNWLTAKITALLLYIALGFVALKYGRSKTVRISAWLAAQAVFGYIALVALHHDPVPFFR